MCTTTLNKNAERNKSDNHKSRYCISIAYITNTPKTGVSYDYRYYRLKKIRKIKILIFQKILQTKQGIWQRVDFDTYYNRIIHRVYTKARKRFEHSVVLLDIILNFIN